MKMNISWAFTGNAVYAACQWLVFVLLVRCLRLAEAGQFAYWIAVTGPVFVLANVRLRNLIATDVRPAHAISDYLTARLLTTAVAVAVALLIGAVLSTGIDSLILVALIACAKACDALSDICHGVFQRELDMRRAAIGLISNGVLSVTLVGLALAVWPSLRLAAAAYAAGSLVTLSAWDLPQMRRLTSAAARVTINGGTFLAARRLIRQALPLGLSSALGSLQINLPRYIIATYLGPAALAVFTALAYLPTLGSLIANAVAQAALPVLARDLRSSPAMYTRRLRTLVQGGVALGAASVLTTAVIGRSVVTSIYGAEVAGEIVVLLWLMTASAITYSFLFLGTASTARMRFGAQLLISSAGLLTVVCSVLPLVVQYGLAGAAYSLLAGAAVEGCAYVGLTWHDLRLLRERVGAVPGPLAEGLPS